MTLYQRYKKLDADFSRLGLEPGKARSDYFCTPKGAKVIGWEGVYGIHYCFIRDFGDMVFAVNPSNLPGDHVHPLARSFEDFLRLLLACGSTAAVEQTWMWNRGEFDAFLQTYPPDPGQRAVLDMLEDKLSLSPMDDPYGYIREVQASFDYSQIPYRKDYLRCVPEEPKAPERPKWKVYFHSGFGPHTGHDRPGREIPVSARFTWGGNVWHVPAVYSCGQGLVVDLCVEIEPAALRIFFEKWKPWLEEGMPLTPEDQDRQIAENPMNVDYDPKVSVNGRELRRRSGNGFGWTPASCRPEYEQGQPGQQDWEAVWFMEHYGLDPERGWLFFRDSFPWATKTRPALHTLTLHMCQRPQPAPGPRFTVSAAGDSVPFTHPATGEEHTLHVVEYEAREMDSSCFQDEDKWEYPTHYTAMSYAVEPELPRESLTVRDCGEGDHPRIKHFDPAGPTAMNSVGILLANGKSGHPRAACSALRFEPPERIEWRMTFYQTAVEDMEVDLPLPQN